MTDPRFFRKYLDIIDEQEPTSATLDLDNAKFTADKSAKTMSGTLNVDPDTTISATRDFNPGGVGSMSVTTKPYADTTLSATRDFSPGGASSVSVTTKPYTDTTLSATHSTPAYNKGQIGGTSQIQGSYKDSAGLIGPAGQTHTVTATKGIGFGGAGKNIKPGGNWATSYTKS